VKYKTAVILCGGRGTRLGDLGKKKPKTLVNVDRYPILWYIILSLLRNSINHFILPLGYKGEIIKKYVEGQFKNKKYNFIIDFIKTGVNTSIAKRIEIVKNFIKSDDFLLLNGDAIFELNLKKIFLNHKKQKNVASFISCHAPLAYGVVTIKKNKIVNFTREINFNTVLSSNKRGILSFVYSGMVILNKIALKTKFKNFDNFEGKLYPKLIKKFNTNLISIKGFWHSVDSIKDLDRLNKKIDINKFNSLIKIKEKNIKYEKRILEK
jgi:glucose-1-phosphate cytidylyltransferase